MTTINDSTNNGHQMMIPDNTSVVQESSATNWVYSQKLKPFGVNSRNPNDQFGFSMAKTDNYLFVGAPFHSYDVLGSNSLMGSGAVWIYQKRNSTLQNDTISYINKKTIFSFTGNDQYFDVPDGVTRIHVKAWAAAGGSTTYARGGAGGFLSGFMKVVPGEQLTIIVGEGGISGGRSRTYGGGGAKIDGTVGASGGGRSAIIRNSWDIFTVGAGGGAGYGAGGAGGGLTAQNGKLSGDQITNSIPTTNYAVGSNVYPYMISPSGYGSQFLGGNSVSMGFNTNGAGGAGYFGGNSGISYVQNNVSQNVGGGGSGGSSNYDVHAFAALPDSSESFEEYQASSTSGNYITVPNTQDEDYFAGVATPAMSNEKSGNGLVVISWDEPIVVDDFLTTISWDEDTKLSASGLNARNANDNFGYSITALGNWLFVGAPGHSYDSLGTNNVSNSGAVWVYKFDQLSKAWIQHSKIVAPSRYLNQNFGYSIKCTSSVLIVGAPGDTLDSSGQNSLLNAGAAYVFRYNFSTDTWNYTTTITPSDRTSEAKFGSVVDLYGYKIVVSAPRESQNKGAVYTFNLNTNQVILEKKFVANVRKNDAFYGKSISLNGNVLSIGSAEDSNDIYTFSAGEWNDSSKFNDNVEASSIVYLNHFEGNSISNFKNECDLSETLTTVGNVFSSDISKFGKNSLGFSINNTNANNRVLTSNTLSGISNAFTIDFWARISNQKTNSSTSSFGDVVIAEKLNSWSFKRVTTKRESSAGFLSFTVNQPSGNYTVKSKNKVPYDKWIHVAGMKFGSKIYLYIDGILVGFQNCSSGSIMSNTNVLTFGSKSFGGYLDEFRITNDAFYMMNNKPVNKFTIPQLTYSLTNSSKDIGVSSHVINDNLIVVGAKTFEGKYSPFKDKPITSTYSNNYPNIKNSGGVYVLSRNSDFGFTSKNILTAPGIYSERTGSNFGKSISLNAGKLVIGAPKNSYNLSQSEYLPNSGAVYVFDFDGQGFVPVTKIVSSDRSTANQNFGDVVSTNGQDIAVSSANYEKIIKGWDENIQDYFYRYCFGSYFGQRVEQYKISADRAFLKRTDNGNTSTAQKSSTYQGSYIGFNTIDLTSVNDFSSTNLIHIKDVFVSLDQTMYQGIPDYNGYGTVISRHKENNRWVETFIGPQTGFTGNRTYQNEYFGWSLKTDGQLIFAGVPGFSYDINGANYSQNSGMVQVFHNPTGGEWTVKASLVGNRNTDEKFGSDVDYDGVNLFGSGTNMVKKFTSSSSFNSGTYYSVHGENSNVLNVSLMGNRLIVGDPANNGFGVSYVYDLQNTFTQVSLIQAAPITEANGRNPNDNFGYSLDTNGDVLVVGSPGFDYDANTGTSHQNIGAVTFYGKTQEGIWEKLSRFNSGSLLTANSRFGTNVSMSGNNVAVLANNSTTSSLLKTTDSKSWTLSRENTHTLSISDIQAISNVSYLLGIPSYTFNGVVGGEFVDAHYTNSWISTSYITPQITNGSINYNNASLDGKLSLNGRKANDHFGYSVSIKPDKSIIFVGSPEHSFGTLGESRQQSSGAIFAYYLNDIWKLQNKYVGQNTANYKFGSKIVASDTNLITSNYQYSANTGIIQTMTLNGTSYSMTSIYQGLTSGTVGTKFGNSIAIDNGKLFVGSPDYSITNFSKLGLVSQYTIGSSLSNRIDLLVTGNSQGRNANDNFGSSVLIADNIFVGAKGQSYSQDGNTFVNNAGAIYKFTSNGEFVEKIFTGVAKLGDKYLSTVGTKIISSGSSGFSILEKSGNTWAQNFVATDSNTQAFFDGSNIVSFSNDTNSLKKVDVSTSSGTSLSLQYTKSQEFINSENVLTSIRYQGNNSQFPIGQDVVISPNGLMLAITNSKKPIFDTNESKIANGEILLFKFNTVEKRFFYWASAYSPETITLDSFGKTIEMTNDELYVGCSGNLVVSYVIHDFGVSIKEIINTGNSSSSIPAIASMETGILVGIRDSNGEEYIGSSLGQVNEYASTVSDELRMLGGNAKVSNSLGVSGAGGGGYYGGSSGTISSFIANGGFGGSNLIPSGWIERHGSIHKNYSSTSVKGIGDGGSANGDSGSNGRVILTYGGTTTNFDFTGSDVDFVVPSGITNISVKVIGAGGGAGYSVRSTNYFDPFGFGGAGGYLEGNLIVTPGDTLNISVGQGGIGGFSDTDTNSKIRSRERSIGGGGIGGLGKASDASSTNFSSGNGGGRSAIKLNGSLIAVAGGGGGGAAYYYSDANVVSVDSTTPYLHGKPAGMVDFVSNDSNIKTMKHYQSVKADGLPFTITDSESFGTSVEFTDESNLFIGSPKNSWNKNTKVSNGGTVYHYTKVNGSWEFQKKFDPKTLVSNSKFGSFVTKDQNDIVVLSDNSTSTVLDSMKNRTNSSNQVISKIDNSSGELIDIASKTSNRTLFLKAISPTQYIIGHPGDNLIVGPSSLSKVGRIEFMTFGTEWTSDIQYPSGARFGRFVNDKFGSSIEMGDSWIAVGVPGQGYDANGETYISQRGLVSVFTKSPITEAWTYAFKKSPSDYQTYGNGFGSSMHLINNELYVGSTINSYLEKYDNLWNSTGVIKNETIVSNEFNVDPQGRLMYGQFDADSANGLFPEVEGAGMIITDGESEKIVAPGLSFGRNVNDRFGTSVYTNGVFFAVGSPNHSRSSFSAKLTDYTGAVFVFGNDLSYEAKLNSTNNGSYEIGQMLAGSGDYLATGQNKVQNPNKSSYVEIFKRTSPGIWISQNIISETSSTDQQQNSALAVMSDGTTVMGRPAGTGSTIPNTPVLVNSGVLRTAKHENTSWQILTDSRIPGASNGRNANDAFGSHLVSSSNYIAVGVPNHSFDEIGNPTVGNTGTVFLYSNDGVNSKILARITMPEADIVENANFGFSLDIDDTGRIMVVGAPGVNKAYVYDLNGNEIELISTLTGSGTFGYAVATNDEKVAVSAITLSSSGISSGAVMMYSRTSEGWILESTVTEFRNISYYDPENPGDFGISFDGAKASGDLMGYSVGISRRALIIGAPGQDTDELGDRPLVNSGSVYFRHI